jgi:hypothetical protein
MKRNKINNIKREINIDPNRMEIDITYSENYIKEIKDMENFLNTLELNQNQIDRLIPRLVEHVKRVRLDGFIQCLTRQFEIKSN